MLKPPASPLVRYGSHGHLLTGPQHKSRSSLPTSHQLPPSATLIEGHEAWPPAWPPAGSGRRTAINRSTTEGSESCCAVTMRRLDASLRVSGARAAAPSTCFAIGQRNTGRASAGCCPIAWVYMSLAAGGGRHMCAKHTQGLPGVVLPHI